MTTTAGAMMPTAKTMKHRLEWFANSPAFALELASTTSRILHNLAFSEAVKYANDTEYGYGPARTYAYADGSILIDDGRGYTAE